ncbi:unnamed protein product, partial [marine sediment metagenome]
DGLAKVKPQAKELLDLVKKKTGKDSFIPLALAADVAEDATSAKAAAFSNAASLLPSAKAKMNAQADELAMDLYETNIRQAFGGAKADAAVKVLRETGDVQKALEAGKAAGKGKLKVFTESQQILNNAARKASGGKYTPAQLRKAAEATAGEGDLASVPFRDTAIKMESVLPKGADTVVGASDVAARDFYHNLGNLIGALPDAIPGLGPLLGSKKAQSFLQGNTKWQKVIQNAVASKDGQAIRRLMSDFRRAMSAQPTNKDDQYNPQGYAQQATEKVSALLGE